MKKLIVILVMFFMYVVYSCMNVNSQDIKKDIALNTIQVDTMVTVIDSTKYTVIIQQKKPVQKKQVVDSVAKIKQQNDFIVNQLKNNTFELKQQNRIIDSMILKKKK